jgi:hypothetical protein
MRKDRMRTCERCGVEVPAGKAVYRSRSEVEFCGSRGVGGVSQLRLCPNCARPRSPTRDVLLVGTAFLMGLLVLLGLVGVLVR